MSDLDSLAFHRDVSMLNYFLSHAASSILIRKDISILFVCTAYLHFEILFCLHRVSERQADEDDSQPFVSFCLETFKPLLRLNFLTVLEVNMVQWNLADRRN